jgi:hypothetical protein
MATTAVSSTSTSSTAASTAATAASTAAATAAANRAAAQKLMTSLNAGSGVDVAALAQNLVDAEAMPQKNAINAKITKNESRISGYAAISFVMSDLNTAFTALKDQNNFSSLQATNSQPNAFAVSTTASAVGGSHDIEVLQLAKAQRSISSGFASMVAMPCHSRSLWVVWLSLSSAWMQAKTPLKTLSMRSIQPKRVSPLHW